MSPFETSPVQRPVERRSAHRQRTLLAGRLSYGEPAVTVSCGIRNLGPDGALIELQAPILLAAPLRLLLARDGVVYDAKVIWRRSLKIGLAFGEPHDLRQAVDPQVRILQALWKEMALR